LQLLWKPLLIQIALVIALLDQLDCLTVCPFVTFIDADNPPLAGKGLGKVVEFEVFVAGVGVPHIVVASWLAVSRIDFPSAVIAESIHKTVFHSGKDEVINSVAIFRDVVLLIDVGVDSSTDTHHPQKFVNIVSGIATYSSVYDQDIVDIQSIANLECFILGRTHC
jgi:hypothetical protein